MISLDVNLGPSNMGMGMDGQSLSSIKELDEELGILAVLVDVTLSEPGNRITMDLVDEKCIR